MSGFTKEIIAKTFTELLDEKPMSKITLVDIRYISPAYLGRFIEFDGQDVLFLYSTLVLNNSDTIIR